ncbi:monomethylamine:corrinoid methyltransferase [Methanoculleus sp. CAG:1088]|nr:monomethylamine:corrinoid methyltransferase [Methanoculleus sp. CAG:1088]
MSLMNMIAGWKTAGDLIMVEQMPMFGGYCGGIEETAICDVAATLASYALMDCDIHLDGPIHIRWGTTTTRETLQIAAHSAAAIDLNTDLLLGNQYYTLAGPCTEMCLLETAAQAITDTASGRELISGAASSKGVVKDRTTGMEARMMGEAAISAAGMDIQEANAVLDNLVSLYERNFSRPPVGKRFQDCYDITSVTPSKEYLKVYEKAISTLNKCGLDI